MPPSYLSHTLSRVHIAHRSDLQFPGILLSGHKHCSPPFNVIGPLISCLTLGCTPNCPLPLQPHPQHQQAKPKTNLVVYTEEWTHPAPLVSSPLAIPFCIVCPNECLVLRVHSISFS